MANETISPDTGDLNFGQRLALLKGIKVVDMTRFLAGPFGSMVLADLGADVLKIEPITGDTTRANPPYYWEGDSAYFLAINRNKRSMALDIRSEKGKEILGRIISQSDVLLDNLRAPQRVRLGLAFPDLEKLNPRIISCSVTGFGSQGPYNDRPAYDIIVEALAGVMSLTGPVGGPSVRSGPPIGDITAGIYAAIGALAGLEYRRRTGKGQHVDVSMLDSQVSLLSYLAQYYFTGGLVATHQGRAHVSIPTYNTFATKDGSEIVIAANTNEMFVSLCQVLGRDDLAEDSRYLTNSERLKNREPLIAELEAEFAKWNAADLDKALVDAEVPVAPINPIDVALADPQARHRDMVVKVRHRSGKDYVTLGTPIKPDHAVAEDFLSPPALGGDTRVVLEGLGYSEEEMARLSDEGVVKFAE